MQAGDNDSKLGDRSFGGSRRKLSLLNSPYKLRRRMFANASGTSLARSGTSHMGSGSNLNKRESIASFMSDNNEDKLND